MRKRKSKGYLVIILGLLAALLLEGCSAPQGGADGLGPQSTQQEQAGDKAQDNTFFVSGPGNYDSADTALLVDKNKEEKTVTLHNLQLGREYTLTVEGTSNLFDKYGEAVSLDQIETGAIVDVTFLKSRKRLNTMQISSQAWVYENVDRYEINKVRNEITIGNEIYKLSKDTLYLSEGRRIDQMDLNDADVLTVRGLDTRALSVQVEKGHGYLKLVNDENFVGGWIEIGQSHIQQITEDMLLTVPEGSYQVLISHRGGGGAKDVIINRNEEVTLDIGDLEVPEAQFGTVIFSLSPSKTTLYIDSEQVDTSQPVTLEYGMHQLIAKADGYKSITTYIKVGQPSAGVDITLDVIDPDSDSDGDEEDEDETDNTTTNSYYKIYVDAPEGAEVYLDGNYVGISPCSFRKTTGAHVITLRKSGFETRSYTVQVDDEEKDLSYSFADLTPTAAQTE